MSRLIDADFACKGCIRYGTSLSCEECVVNDAPTVDAVPVVRCKDCTRLVLHKGIPICSKWRTFPEVELEGFCSYGERKEGADNGA